MHYNMNSCFLRPGHNCTLCYNYFNYNCKIENFQLGTCRGWYALEIFELLLCGHRYACVLCVYAPTTRLLKTTQVK